MWAGLREASRQIGLTGGHVAAIGACIVGAAVDSYWVGGPSEILGPPHDPIHAIVQLSGIGFVVAGGIISLQFVIVTGIYSVAGIRTALIETFGERSTTAKTSAPNLQVSTQFLNERSHDEH